MQAFVLTTPIVLVLVSVTSVTEKDPQRRQRTKLSGYTHNFLAYEPFDSQTDNQHQALLEWHVPKQPLEQM